MMTPLELEKLEFDKTMNGYKRASVDDCFNLIKTDYETIYKENIALKDKIGVLEELIAKYKAMEDTLQSDARHCPLFLPLFPYYTFYYMPAYNKGIRQYT